MAEKKKRSSSSSAKRSGKIPDKLPIPVESWQRLLKASKDGKIPFEQMMEIAEITAEDNAVEYAFLEAALNAEGIVIVDQISADEEDDDEKSEGSTASDMEPLQIYIQDINRTPLLDAEREVALAKKIHESQEKIRSLIAATGLTPTELRKYLRAPDMPEPPPLKGRDRRTLAKQAAALIAAENTFAEAQRILIESNLRLVVSIAKRYAFHGLHLLDLINEGNLGLIRAIEKFDYRLGFKFSTYASWWIRQAIRRAIADQGRIIRVPVHVSDSINRWIKATRLLSQKYGREPTLQETAKEMGLAEPRLLEIVKVSQEPSSLEAPIQAAQESPLSELIEDTAAISPYKAVLSLVFTEYLDKMLATLQEKERKIVEMRFGLFGQAEKTLEEVGQMLSITRERVRQLEVRALKKLRHLRLAEELFSMMVEMGH